MSKMFENNKKKMTIIGLITARGGSKSIPGKNIKPLAGKPLIAWTIEVALQCKELSRLIVSTDNKKIAEVARQWGAEVPFIRPAELAQDDSSHIAVVLHAIHWLKEKEGFCPDYIMLLQPTSPFRTVEDMLKAIKLAKDQHAVAVISVCEAAKHPYKTYKIIENGTLEYFISSNIEYKYRQALPKVYEENGAIYLNECLSLRQDKTFLPQGAIAYVMPQERSLDVDTPWDFYVADLVLRNQGETEE
jgi:CMP-N,N'-diacetyllegionaminic acid synthase